MEIARIGLCGNNEVYVETDDTNTTPHFHVRGDTETCIQLRENKYFHHGRYTEVLNTKDRKTLAEFMESTNPNLNMTNYKATCILWNMNNSTNNITQEEMETIPNYRTIN